MECLFNRKEFDGFTFVSTTSTGVSVRIHISDSQTNRDGFRATVHTDEFGKWTITTSVAQFNPKTVRKTFLTERGSHYVGHDPIL